MSRRRLGAVLALVTALAVTGAARQANAAAEVHRLSLVLSAIPTQVDGGHFNDYIDFVNETELLASGLETLDKITFAWLFDAELRYFLKPNVAVSAGVGQLRSTSSREFLPALQQSDNRRAEVLSIPIHLGGAYYFTPYNQGDFQARAYLGGGFLGLVYNKALLERVTTYPDTTPPPTNYRLAFTRDAPGYYAEVGVHMFFAARWSVLLGAVYRNAEIRGMVNRETGGAVRTPPIPGYPDGFLFPLNGEPFTLDVGGVGARLAVGIGF